MTLSAYLSHLDSSTSDTSPTSKGTEKEASMGSRIAYRANGHDTPGYLALPDRPGRGVVVVQEWWGLVPHIEQIADRFAAEGFVALAPDLYHGQKATTPDQAGKMMMAMRIDEAAKDIDGA